MTELDLYKFIENNSVEVDWREDELLIWLEHYDLDSFCDLLNRCDADDGGLHCQLQNGGVVVLNLVKVCEEHDINPENILSRRD